MKKAQFALKLAVVVLFGMLNCGCALIGAAVSAGIAYGISQAVD